MAKGSKCPFCGELTLHDSGSLSECSTCRFVGWQVGHPVYPGSGKGFRCVTCSKQTLHYLINVADADVEVFRCSTCLYAGVRPASE